MTQAQGSDGNGGCTNNWEAAWKIVQLGEDRHQGEGGGPHLIPLHKNFNPKGISF